MMFINEIEIKIHANIKYTIFDTNTHIQRKYVVKLNAVQFVTVGSINIEITALNHQISEADIQIK